MMNYKLNQNIFQSSGTVEFRFFEPPREMEIGSKLIRRSKIEGGIKSDLFYRGMVL